MCPNAAQDKPIFVLQKTNHIPRQMKRIRSLEEIREYGREWAALPTKTVRAIPDEEIMNLFIAANKFVPELLQHDARLYGFPNYKGASVGWLRRAAGLCYNKTNIITIDFLHVLFADDVAFNATLLHELCHTEVHNHTVAFWELFDQKLKEASIIDRGDNSRKVWLQKPWFRNDDGLHLYNTPGNGYENVSDHKRKAIRDKVCYGFSQNRQWMMRSDQLYLSDIFRVLYNVGDGVHGRKWLPEIIEKILTGYCTLLTTFDYTDAFDFFKGKQIVETYVGYGRGDAKAIEAFRELSEAVEQHQALHTDCEKQVRISALLIFSAHASSAFWVNDMDKVREEKFFTAIQMCIPIFIEDPDLAMDVFCAHLIVAKEYSY